MGEHTPTPWFEYGWSVQANGRVDTFDGPVRGSIARTTELEYSDGDGRVWEALGKRDANTKRIVACVNAFHSPTRTIATENIEEGVFWKLYEALEGVVQTVVAGGGANLRGKELREIIDLLSSLKTEEGFTLETKESRDAG